MDRARRRGEHGFTLIELLVVVLVIAVLVAIAVPTFLTARQRASERAAQANARTAQSAVRAQYADSARFTDDVALLSQVEPALEWTNTPPIPGASPRVIAIEVFDVDVAGDQQLVIITGRASTGRCFYLKDVGQVGGTGEGTYFESEIAPSAPCSPPAPGDAG